jgi:putative glutamine amidotransferase
LAEILGTASFSVNSLHGQAVGQLAPGLRLEAVAPDGVVEAFSVDASPGFALCVQWHPEWQAASNPQSMALLKAFGRALEAQRLRRVSLEKSSEEVPEAEGQPY